LRERILRTKHVEQGNGRHSAQGKPAGAIKELALADFSMGVGIVEIEKLLVEILRGQPGHRKFLFLKVGALILATSGVG